MTYKGLVSRKWISTALQRIATTTSGSGGCLPPAATAEINSTGELHAPSRSSEKNHPKAQDSCRRAPTSPAASILPLTPEGGACAEAGPTPSLRARPASTLRPGPPLAVTAPPRRDLTALPPEAWRHHRATPPPPRARVHRSKSQASLRARSPPCSGHPLRFA